jgi:predicted nucleic acid-binding protein
MSGGCSIPNGGHGPAHCRFLRRKGVTTRKTIDLVIAAFWIARGHSLLREDGNFAPMERFLGLRAA